MKVYKCSVCEEAPAIVHLTLAGAYDSILYDGVFLCAECEKEMEKATGLVLGDNRRNQMVKEVKHANDT